MQKDNLKTLRKINTIESWDKVILVIINLSENHKINTINLKPIRDNLENKEMLKDGVILRKD